MAGPTASGAKLVAFDRKGELCTAIRVPEEGVSSVDCTRSSPRLREPSTGADSFSSGGAHGTLTSGLLAPEVASLELVYRGGTRVGTPAETGERYRGRFAGRVRFFIAETRGRRFQSPVYIRLLAPDGELLAAVEGLGAFQEQSGPEATLASGRVGETRWRLAAYRRRQFTPLPGDEERFEALVCTRLTARGSRTRGEACVGEDQREDLTLGRDQGCSPLGAAVPGIVSTRVTRVEAVLGDGSSRRLDLRAFPARFRTDRRAFALALGPGVAARKLVAYGSKGPVRTEPLRLAPGSIRCGGSGAFLAFAFHDDEAPPPRPDADGPDLLVRDQGALLCLAIDAFDTKGRDCARPPLRTFESRFESQAGPRGTLIAAVVPQDVAAVQLELNRGERRQVDATPDGPYTGRYRGVVRFITLSLPGRRMAYSARLLDERGRVIETMPGPDPRPLDVAFRTLARVGELRLGAAVGRPFDPKRRVACLELTAERYSRDSDSCGAFPGVAEVRSFCGPRRIVLWGLARPGMRSVSVRTDRRLIRGRVIPLPRALKLKRSVFLVTVPASEAPRELIRTRRRTVRQELRLPPAARQCGYDDFAFLKS